VNIDQVLDFIGKNNLLPKDKTVKIAVAMSGGVDSSVATALIKELGYQTFGLTGWLLEGEGKCCQGGVIDSAEVCEQLGIEHDAQDLRNIFNTKITSSFLSGYSQGKTPVPCMPCNTEIKWGSMLAYVKEKNINYLASGHYARLLEIRRNLCIGRSLDQNKDQSYMLWGLTQEQLASVVFPLANLEKEEIRAIAKKMNLPVFDKPESQDLCFVPGKNQDYLLEKLGIKPGQIKHIQTGEVLGEHKGTYLYTIGQRKGLKVSYPEPLYVIELDIFNNFVLVGEKNFLYSQELIAQNANWQVEVSSKFNSLVKVRYNSAPVLAQIEKIDENKFKVLFEKKLLSITPGQACVLYDLDNQYIIGGGWIEKSET